MIENEQEIVDAIGNIRGDRDPQSVADEAAYYQDDAVKALEARWAREAERDELVSIRVFRDEHGDWHLTMTNEHGSSTGNFGTTENMLAGLFDYLHACGAGNWQAFENETPR
jgi:hypothetical protein